MKILLLLLTTMIVHVSNGQDIKPIGPADQSPGTIRVLGEVLSVKKNEVCIKVLKMLGTGQGIINPLSEGDTVRLATVAKSSAKASDRIVADLKEKFGADPNKSEYVVISLKKSE